MFLEEERIISYTLILLRSFLQILSIFNKKFHLKVVPIQISMLLIFRMIFKGVVPVFLALPTNARIFVFRLIIEYSSLSDFGPYVIIGLFFRRIFER